MPEVLPRHDDRLNTVLALPTRGQAMARIQWRQLIDLIGTVPAGSDGPLTDAAHLRLAELAAHIPAPARAAMLAEPGLRLRSPRLLAGIVVEGGAVAAAALDAAELTASQWQDLIPALPAAARSRLAHRQDLPVEVWETLARLGARRVGLPAPAAETPAVPSRGPRNAAPPPAAPANLPPPDSIGAIVARIEAVRRTRQARAATALGDSDAPPLPLGDEPFTAPPPLDACDFATDAAGRIVWCDTAPALVGASLRFLAGGDAHVRRALATHLPLRAATAHLAGSVALAGQWQIDATPRFATDGGRYIGHIGRLRRCAEVPPVNEIEPDADRLRQVLHELRTPVNAIQGFAELIQQQLFGSVGHGYRAYAATIAADAARMLAGFEELERLARLESGAVHPEAGRSDIAAALTTAAARLAPGLAAAGGGLALHGADAPRWVPLSDEETERMIGRLLAPLAARAEGKTLAVVLTASDHEVVIDAELPKALAGLDEPALFRAHAGGEAGLLGAGFGLRLLAAETRAAGGSLRLAQGRLNLALPGLTAPMPSHSEETSAAAPAD